MLVAYSQQNNTRTEVWSTLTCVCSTLTCVCSTLTCVCSHTHTQPPRVRWSYIAPVHTQLPYTQPRTHTAPVHTQPPYTHSPRTHTAPVHTQPPYTHSPRSHTASVHTQLPLHTQARPPGPSGRIRKYLPAHAHWQHNNTWLLRNVGALFPRHPHLST